MTKTVYCPSCGKPQHADVIANKMYFKCDKCRTQWTVTFDTGEEAARKAFICAEDYPD